MASAEDYIIEHSGQIDALGQLCSAMLAWHPHREQIVNLLQKSLDEADALSVAKPHLKIYADGMRKMLSVVELTIKTVEQAEQIKSLKPEGGH